MEQNNDKIVEIARFQYPAEAYTLMALLESEGITCYLRNEQTAQLLSYLDVGGARVEILEKDVPEALRIMQEGGYEIPEEETTYTDPVESKNWTQRIPFIGKQSFLIRISFLVILLIVLLYALVFGGKLV